MISRTMFPDRRVGMLLASIALLMFAALAGAVVLPAADAQLSETSVDRRSLGEEERRGMDVFRAEGCWYCHTQQVRLVATDAGLGTPLRPGDYPDTGPGMLGSERIGPDLTHVGSRYSERELERLLLDPREGRRRSSMPSYAHLSGRDLDHLVAYLSALE